MTNHSIIRSESATGEVLVLDEVSVSALILVWALAAVSVLLLA